MFLRTTTGNLSGTVAFLSASLFPSPENYLCSDRDIGKYILLEMHEVSKALALLFNTELAEKYDLIWITFK